MLHVVMMLWMTAVSTAPAEVHVKIFDSVAYAGGYGPGQTATGILPPAETMASFNSMTVTMTLGCGAAGCPPWDFVANLDVCENGNANACNTEIARWITPYGAGGSWTTDISPMLATLQKGGAQTFYFWTPQAYTVSVELTLGTTHTGTAPSRAIALFSGGNLDLTYNPAHAPVVVNFAQKPLKAEIFTLVTGHGWGNNTEDCAEFCNIAHHFGVGGKDYSVDFPQAGTATGCEDLVSQGVVPNQAGTWQYGRDGWCPGWDVHPFVADVTASLKDGNNTVTYEALYNGQPYRPTTASSPPTNAINATIALSSYLVVWDAPTVPAPSPPNPNAPAAAAPTLGDGDDTSDSSTHAGCAAAGDPCLALFAVAGFIKYLRKSVRSKRHP